jgi:prepilin-type processing-associated H-X9-DG protein
MLCSRGFGRHSGMTAEKGKFMKKSAAVVAGAIMALGMAAPAFADGHAEGAAVGSPGVLSGNVVQVPVNVDANVCGNTINVVGLLNPAFGNVCVND